MATRKDDEGQAQPSGGVGPSDRTTVDAETVRQLERQYRDGVDISEEEVLARFEADGYNRADVEPYLTQRDQPSEEG